MRIPPIAPRTRLMLLAAYVVLVIAAFLFFDIPLLVEWVALILFGGALIAGRGGLFFRDWGVFVAALLAWQVTAPVATELATPWHLTELIDADRWLFHGTVPTQWLQAHLYHPHVLEPWDVFAVVMYALHFFAPLLVGFVLWLTNRNLFQKFAVAFLLVAVAGFATYIIYPAVPPWYAAEHLVASGTKYFVPYVQMHGRWVEDVRRVAIYVPGRWIVDTQRGHVYLPGVQNLFDAAVSHWYNPYNGDVSIGFLHQHIDQVGAMPSQHAAFPMLCFLFLRRQFGRFGYLMLLYVAGITFSIVYLGQHYVIDALVGFAYAGAGYVVVMVAAPYLQAILIRHLPKPWPVSLSRLP